MTKQLNIAIIGCGGIANGKHMPSLSRLPQVQVTAFCDIQEDLARKAANEYGAEGAKTCTDYRELLQDPAIDAVHVCTPNDRHAEIAIAALEAGKHVNCEKPMAKTAVEARRMYEASAKSNRKLTISYQNRFRPDSRTLYHACRRGDLGEIYFAKAHAVRRRGVPTWGVFLDKEKQGGGPLIDIGTHALDLTLYMMNNYKPRWVLGSTYHKLSQRTNAANSWGPWNPEKFTVEDSAFGMIKMENGATVMLETSWALNTLETEEARCTLCGTEGGADMKDKGLRFNGERDGKLYTTHVDLNAGGADYFEGTKEKAADTEMRLWVDAILNDEEPPVLPFQAMVVSEILEAVYESARKGEPVSFK